MAETINWTACDVELGDLKPWDRNPKSISKNHARRLIEYWQRIGQFQTIAIGPGGEVYDGHQRLSCLLSVYGASYVVKCLRASRPLTDEERQELVIAAHVGTTGQFDWDALSGWDAGQLQEWGMDAETLASWRADAIALTEMLEAAKEEPPEDPGAQIDKADELREKWGVETGQLWKLGEHRILCGDCLDSENVALVLSGEKAQMVFTDPPYGVNYEGGGGDSIAGDTTYAAIPIFFDIMAHEVLAEKAWFYVCGGSSNMGLYSKLVDRYFHTFPRVIVWDKGAMTMRHNSYHSSFEMIYFGYTKGAGDWWFGSRAGEQAADVWHVAKPTNKERSHLTEKPVELPYRAIVNSCPPDGIVFEPFSGSGSTLIASEQAGRRCFAIELSPAYVAVAIQRWVDMTGGTPELITS